MLRIVITAYLRISLNDCQKAQFWFSEKIENTETMGGFGAALHRVPSKMNMGFSRYFQGFFKAFSVDFKVFLCSGSSD